VPMSATRNRIRGHPSLDRRGGAPRSAQGVEERRAAGATRLETAATCGPGARVGKFLASCLVLASFCGVSYIRPVGADSGAARPEGTIRVDADVLPITEPAPAASRALAPTPSTDDPDWWRSA